MSGNTRNSSIWTWTGLTDDYKFNETFGYLYSPDLDNIEIDFPKTEKLNKYLYNLGAKNIGAIVNKAISTIKITTRLLIPHGMCKVYEGRPLSYVRIALKDSAQMVEYYVFVADPAAANSFQLPYSTMSGDTITFKVENVGKFRSYNINLKEKVVTTDDGMCTHYPTSDHNNYSDCVDDEMKLRKDSTSPGMHGSMDG